MTAAADRLSRLAAIGADLVRRAPALVVALLAFLESIGHALDAVVAERKPPPPAPAVIAHVDTAAPVIASADLLELLRREVIGWSAERVADAEQAFRAVAELAAGRGALVLVGKGSLSSVARRLVRLALGDQPPFIELDRGAEIRAALERAAGGVLYLDARPWHLPRDLSPLLVSARELAPHVRLIVGAASADEAAAVVAGWPRVSTLVIRTLAERPDEIDALLDLYVQEAAKELGAPAPGLRPGDLALLYAGGWIETVADLADAARRLVALRAWGVLRGAARLGISHGALSRWARRWGLPT